MIELIVIFVMEYTGRWERGDFGKARWRDDDGFCYRGGYCKTEVGNIVRTKEAGVLFIDAHSIT